MFTSLPFASGLALAGVTASVSLAAAMGGMEALAPAARHSGAPAAESGAHGAPAVHLAGVAVTAHHGSGAAHGQTGAGATTGAAVAVAASSAAACTVHPLPSWAAGVGNRCTSGPPSAVPGNGHPGAPASPAHGTSSPGRGGGTPANSSASQPPATNHGQANGVTKVAATPAAHGPSR